MQLVLPHVTWPNFIWTEWRWVCSEVTQLATAASGNQSEQSSFCCLIWLVTATANWVPPQHTNGHSVQRKLGRLVRWNQKYQTSCVKTPYCTRSVLITQYSSHFTSFRLNWVVISVLWNDPVCRGCSEWDRTAWPTSFWLVNLQPQWN